MLAAASVTTRTGKQQGTEVLEAERVQETWGMEDTEKGFLNTTFFPLKQINNKNRSRVDSKMLFQKEGQQDGSVGKGACCQV